MKVVHYPDLLKPQSSQPILLPSGREVRVPKTMPIFRQWSGTMPNDRFGNKPILDFNGEMVFAELAILRAFQRAGWEGRWIDSFRHKYRCGYWGKDQDVTRDPPIERPSIPSWNAIRAIADNRGGCFDVFCWRGKSVLFAEAKWKGHDRIRLSQRRWLEAALSKWIPLTSFLIVEWSLDRA